MAQVGFLEKHLRKGKVYRREDLTQWSKSVDRHLEELTQKGTLQKLSTGLYYYPKDSVFGKMPPAEEEVVRSFLKDDRFLLTSLNAYNRLGVGTTQLYNQPIVYNHKRHGEFKLGNRTFYFRVKPNFPSKVTDEFLMVDLINNLDELAEDRSQLDTNIKEKVADMDSRKLKKAILEYGGAKAKRFLLPLLPTVTNSSHAY